MRLHEYIQQHLNTPFEWGTHDCICFAVGWFSLQIGEDLLAPYKPWSSAAEAWAIADALGGLPHMFDQRFVRINPNFAKDGALTIVGNTCYLFSGSDIVSVGESGLLFVNRQEAKCAWSL